MSDPVKNKPRRLSELPLGSVATVDSVDQAMPDDPIAERLRDLGFVRGEPVRLLASGPIGADPLLVQIGFTRFALRQGEARRVLVHTSKV
jgi:ferrous iron transport protein A